jgi:hypothetical protein
MMRQKLTLGLDLSLAQTESPGNVTGRAAVATSVLYLSFNITQGKEEKGIATFKAAGPAGELPDPPFLPLSLQARNLQTEDCKEAEPTRSVIEPTILAGDRRGESEGMGIRGRP